MPPAPVTCSRPDFCSRWRSRTDCRLEASVARPSSRRPTDNQLVSNHGYQWVNPSGDEPMKKRRNTPQPDEAAEASSSGTAIDPVDAARASGMTGEIPIIAAPRLADALAPAAAGCPRPRTPAEAARIEAEPHVRGATPLLA